jgi:hypothetical protein
MLKVALALELFPALFSHCTRGNVTVAAEFDGQTVTI